MVDIICGVKEGLRKVNDAAAVSTARSKVAGILKTARPPKRNIDKEKEQALKELKEEKDIVILKADQDKCTVITDRPDRDQKINALLNDNHIYSKLVIKRNPLNNITKDVSDFVYQLLLDNKIKQDKHYWLHCSKAIMPRFYRLPKIRKINVPLRPIVSFINSPTYNISKFLPKIIKPLMTNRFCVKNSIDFIDRIKDGVIEEDDILVSFDVASLCTSIPVDCAIKCIFDYSWLMILYLHVHNSMLMTWKLALKSVLILLFFLFKTFCIDKRLVLPWGHASLPLWLTSSWSI